MNISSRQQAILDFIRDFSAKANYPPTLREIGQAVGISSSSVVNYNLNILEQKGLIEREREKSRGIKLINNALKLESTQVVHVPLLGHIVAGTSMPTPTTSFRPLGTDAVEITRELLPVDVNTVFALQVRGNSMADAMISDGDIIVIQVRTRVNNGEFVAVLLKDRDETTLKRFYLENECVRLQPINPTLEPIFTNPNNVEVQGKVVLVIRQPN